MEINSTSTFSSNPSQFRFDDDEVKQDNILSGKMSTLLNTVHK